MHMRRRSLAWVDQRIDTVDNVLSATETQHREALRATELRRSLRDGGEEESREQHDDSQCLFTEGCVDDEEVQDDAEKTPWKIKYSKRTFYEAFTPTPCDPHTEALPICLDFRIRHATADPIRTKKHILRSPQLHLIRTTSWHRSNVGSCGANMLIPHSAKGLRLLHQPDCFLWTTCGTGPWGSTHPRGDTVKNMGMEVALSERSESWHEA